jgi:hypothetical protein
MFTKLKIAFAAATILAAASAAPAKDGDLPTIDLQKVCRATEKEINAVFADINRNVFEACMNDEQTAREQLVKDWATFPGPEKARCIHPRDYLPSYVEWIICIEMARDVRRMRKDQPAAQNARSPKGRTGSETQQCPVVQWRDDGTVAWVIAC